MPAKRSLAVALAGAVAVASLSAAGAPPSKGDAASMKQKVDAINQGTPKRRTVITQNEVNAYFRFEAVHDLPAGVVDPEIAILGDGRLSGHAVVDLDAVRKASPPKGLLDPKNLLAGRLPLSAVGVLATAKGVGHFALESASLGSLPLPKALLDQILGFYSRSPEHPDGLSLDDAFPLPAGIQEIQVTRGQALVIQ